MTTPTTDAREQEAREALDRVMEEYASNEHPSREYPHNQRKYDNDVAANRELLDAYRTAVRAAVLAECIATVEGMRRLAHGGSDLNEEDCVHCAHNTAIDTILAKLRAGA